MEGSNAGNQQPPWGAIAGAAAAFIVILRIRKRRKKKKLEKLLKAREKARLERKRAEEKRLKKEKPAKKAAKGKKEKKERSLVEQLVRFTVFQLLKKVISSKIKEMEIDLGKSKIGEKVVAASETAKA